MRYFTALLLLLLSTVAFSQFNIGVKAGFSYSSLTGSFSPRSDIKYPKQGKLGYVFGAFGDYKASEKFGLRTEILYTIEGEIYEYHSTTGSVFTETYDFTFHYIRIPVLFQYYPINRFSIFIGPYVDYMLHANLRLEFETEFQKELLDTDINKAFSTWHFGLMGGFGYEFDSGLSIDLRYTYGLTDLIELDLFPFEDTRQSILTLAVGFH